MRKKRSVLSVLFVAILYWGAWGAKATELSRQAPMRNENELHYALLQKEVACQKFLEGVFRDEWIFLCVFCVGSANTCLWVTTYLLESKK